MFGAPSSPPRPRPAPSSAPHCLLLRLAVWGETRRPRLGALGERGRREDHARARWHRAGVCVERTALAARRGSLGKAAGSAPQPLASGHSASLYTARRLCFEDTRGLGAHPGWGGHRHSVAPPRPGAPRQPATEAATDLQEDTGRGPSAWPRRPARFSAGALGEAPRQGRVHSGCEVS